MKVKEYFTEYFDYKVNIEAMKNSGKQIIQFLSITAGVYGDRQMEITINIRGRDVDNEFEEREDLFNVKSKFVVKYSMKIKSSSISEKEDIEKYVLAFYPYFQKFIADFYQKQAGLINLVAPDFN